MTRQMARPLIALASLMLAAACTTKADVAADTIYTGGDTVTVNYAQPTGEPLAVKDG